MYRRYNVSSRLGPTRYYSEGRRRNIGITPTWNYHTIDTPLSDEREELPSPTNEDSDTLKATKVDNRCGQNAVDHHTDKFEQVDKGTLVVRRGQKFSLTITFSRPYNENEDEVRLLFDTGSSPMPGNGTHVQCTTGDRPKAGQWSSSITSRTGRDVTFVVTPSPDCIVGKWRLCVESRSGGETNTQFFRYQNDESFYILFNPWCRDDLVYMNDGKLSEYILNDSGAIFVGNHKQIGAKPWHYGQFEEGILDTSISCINKAFGFKVSKACGDPVRVARAISKIVNNNDDGGVLMGNWTGNYPNGKNPLSWTGSVEILRSYVQTQRPVKWGQCFVFSGIVTTICRAIGIPCRTVTNFSSAHDTDGNLTLDVYWDIADGEEKPLDRFNVESIWNFHVWNDVWMKRVDLPPGHDGWQAIDATPQECSAGQFQCGPASLRAIRNRDCNLLYDTPFIFAEVSADRVHWGRTASGEWTVIDTDKNVTGQKISTKVPDGRPVSANLTNCEKIREDITDQYKARDGTSMDAYYWSRSMLNRTGMQDLNFKFLTPDDLLIGNEIQVALDIENRGDNTRTVSGRILCVAVSYTGRTIQTVKIIQFSLAVQRGDKERAVLPIKPDDYLSMLGEAAAMKVSAVARIQETGQVRTWQDDFRLRKPDLEIEVLSSRPRVGIPVRCKAHFKNPLNCVLRNCKLNFEGPGLDAPRDCSVGDIYPDQQWSAEVEFKPRKPGLKQLSFSLGTNILTDISGVKEIYVQK